MIGAAILFGSKYTPSQLVGAIGAVVAIILYSHVTIKEKKTDSDRDKDDLTIPLVSSSSSKAMKSMNAATTY
eukprot:12840196-Ditylum_brightwellii.AAC.1